MGSPFGSERNRPSQRQLKVGETMRHALAEWLARGELQDPLLEGASVTISEVRASRDLKQATAFVSVLSTGADERAVLDVLQRAAPRLGGRLARALHLKYAPRLRFAFDDRFDEVARIEKLLHHERDLLERGDENQDRDRDGA